MSLLPGSAGAAEGELRPDAVRGSRADLGPERAVPRETITPLAPGRYKVQFTAGAELRDKLDRLRALMRSSVPDGDLAAIIDAAVTEKLERLEARRFGRTKAPRKAPPAAQEPPSSRHVPAAVRRAVYERDGGRCRYIDDQGRRCSAREGLEFHHRHPFALGGRHSVDEMALLCRTHNGFLAEIDFGREAVARHRRSDAASRTRAVKPQAPFSP
jgi:5-methylcytosine-specific restriction endonuclease McrA